MKGDATVIEYLNKALTNELTAINQYWLHYRVLDDWGVTKLAEYERKESIEEMEHADKLMSLRGNNEHFARATVHHELIPGHHLQGRWYIYGIHLPDEVLEKVYFKNAEKILGMIQVPK